MFSASHHVLSILLCVVCFFCHSLYIKYICYFSVNYGFMLMVMHLSVFSLKGGGRAAGCREN